jgi:hypothetical protein
LSVRAGGSKLDLTAPESISKDVHGEDLESKLAEERAHQSRLMAVLDAVNASHDHMLELLASFEDRDPMTCSAGSHMH